MAGRAIEVRARPQRIHFGHNLRTNLYVVILSEGRPPRRADESKDLQLLSACLLDQLLDLAVSQRKSRERYNSETIFMSETVGLPEVAKRLSLDGGTVRRFIARENETLKLTLLRGKGDKLLLSRPDADRLVAAYEARRGPVAEAEEGSPTDDRFGFFYLIQLVPEALPNRVKLGFADNVERRLNEHRTAAPTATVLKSWPCKRSWDYAAMASITREGCKLVLNEVFEGEIGGFIERGDRFFGLMPTAISERELSEHSPLYERDEAN
jgi:hypothetical protein